MFISITPQILHGTDHTPHERSFLAQNISEIETEDHRLWASVMVRNIATKPPLKPGLSIFATNNSEQPLTGQESGVEDIGSDSFIAQSLKDDLESAGNKQRIMSKIVPLTRDEGQYTWDLALSRAKKERKSIGPVLLPPFNSEIVYSEQLEEPNAFDNQIELYEKEAQEKYEAAVKDLQDVELSGWLNRLLERRIIPGLRRIGFDGPLDWALFKMAAPSWKLMGPISDKDVWFHPVLIREIEEIRSNIILKAKRNSKALSLLKSFTPQELLSFAKKMIHPGNLFELIEDISAPWIILPRAYDHLKEHHSRYLPGYLNYLYKETDLAFAKILTRIIIEFMGNYTLKYISEIHPKNQMIHALFYGYVAMFWRNLRNPPNGFEHIGIFENFLYWAKMFQNRFPFVSCDMARIIEIMEDEKEKFFPVINAFGLARDSQNDAGRFLVTLRHGYLGIEAAIKYFGPGGPLLKNATDGRLPYAAVPTALSVLFKEIKKSYYHEAPQTQGFIREFLLKLKAVYGLERLNMVFSGGELPEQLRFSRPRAIGMINDLTASIH